MNAQRTTLIAALTALAATPLACKEKQEPTPAEAPEYTKTAAYTQPEATDDQPPIVFTDITAPAGLDFVHYTGAFGKKWMPETIGSGGGFLDYDGDGDQDIFLVNGSDWPGHRQRDPQPTMALYANRGDATFEEVTQQAGLDITCYGMGCTFGDYDNDGDPDIYVTTVGDNIMLRNDGGQFTDVSQTTGASGNDPEPGSPPSWTTSATFLDYDRDGRLDLFVANYVKWTPETDIWTTLDGETKSYATPQQYNGQSCRLYRNVDGRRFEDVTITAAVFNDHGKSLGVVADDFNDDGWPDIFITNDTQPNYLYINNADAADPGFAEIAKSAGCGYDDTGRARAGMGVDVADVNNESVPAIAIGNFADEPVSLYSRIGDAHFQDSAGNARISRPTLKCLTFGVRFDDFDLDGYQDLMLANGHIEPEIHKVRNEVTFAQPPQLFRNNQNGEFVDVSAAAGASFNEPIVGRGIATADVDDDGDLDVLFTVNGGPAKLFRNDTENPHHWIKLDLRRADTGAPAYGARIMATAGDLTQRRTLRAASSYLTQSAAPIVLGLGSRDALDTLEVRWPDGRTQTLRNLPADQAHRITQTPTVD